MQGELREQGGQGTGYATVLQPDNTLYNRLYEQAQQKKLQKAADADAYAKALKESFPEWSYLWNAQLSKEKDEWITKGGELIGKGITNPFVATDPESREFVKGISSFTARAKQSMELQTEFAKIMDDIRTRGDQYTEESKIAAVGQFYNNPLDKFLDGQVKLEPLKFKAPVTSVVATESSLVKGYNEINSGKLMSPEDAHKIASDVMLGEAHKNYVDMMKQLWADDLTESERKAFQARGVNMGDATGFTTFVADRLLDRSGVKPGDLSRVASDIASKVSVDQTGGTTEDPTSGKTVTTQSRYYNKAATRAALKSKLLNNTHWIDKEVEDGLYGNKDMNPDEKLNAATEYYMKQIDNEVSTLYTKSTTFSGQGQGGADQAMIQNANKWLADYRGNNGIQASIEAANRFVGAKIKGGEVISAVFDVPTYNYKLTISKSFFDTMGTEMPDVKDKDKFAEFVIKDQFGANAKTKILNSGDLEIVLDRTIPKEAALGFFEAAEKNRKIPYGAIPEPEVDLKKTFKPSQGGEYNDLK